MFQQECKGLAMMAHLRNVCPRSSEERCGLETDLEDISLEIKIDASEKITPKNSK